MHFAMGAKNCLTLECVHSVSRHVMSKNALDSRIKEGTLDGALLELTVKVQSKNEWR